MTVWVFWKDGRVYVILSKFVIDQNVGSFSLPTAVTVSNEDQGPAWLL